ncbi:hypothetical protein CCP3SC1AL1_2110004 [Gammaproteobacteria bacterium]
MLQFNVPDDSTYGLGILYPALTTINNLYCEKDIHTYQEKQTANTRDSW